MASERENEPGVKRKRDYKLEAAMLQRIVGAITFRAPGQWLSVTNIEVEEAQKHGLEIRQTAEGVEFRIPVQTQSKIITIH